MTEQISDIQTVLRRYCRPEEKLRPDWNSYFISVALLTSIRSSCHRLHVGCVIVKDNRILSTGYNGFLPNAPHKSIVINDHEQATVHAEQNSITDAAKRGINVDGGTAYVTHYACCHCAKILAAAGIKQIYYYHDYKNNPIVHQLLSSIGIKLVKLKRQSISI